MHDTYKKRRENNKKIEPTDDSDVINKAYLEEKLKKIDGHISYLEKDYNKFKLQFNKQTVEQIIIWRALKTTIQILYDEGLFDKYANTDKVLEIFLFTTRRRGDLSEQVNDGIQRFYSQI